MFSSSKIRPRQATNRLRDSCHRDLCLKGPCLDSPTTRDQYQPKLTLKARCLPSPMPRHLCLDNSLGSHPCKDSPIISLPCKGSPQVRLLLPATLPKWPAWGRWPHLHTLNLKTTRLLLPLRTSLSFRQLLLSQWHPRYLPLSRKSSMNTTN